MSIINSKLKRIFILVLAFFAVFALAACGKEDEKILKEIHDVFVVGDLSDVKTDFELPKKAKKGEYEADVTWESNNPEVIEIVEIEDETKKASFVRAKVIRPEDSNVTVTLTATLKYGKKTLEKKFQATVVVMEMGTPIADIRANGVLGTKYTVVGTVIYSMERGFIVQDNNKDNIFIFGSNHGRKVGEFVEVEGEYDVFYNMPQLKNAVPRVLEENKTVNLAESAEELTVSDIVALNYQDQTVYTKVVKLEATITKSGNYVDIADSGKKISLSNDSIAREELESYAGKRVELLVIVYDYHDGVKLWRVLFVPGSVTVLDDVKPETTTIADVRRNGTTGSSYTVEGTVVYVTDKAYIIQDSNKELLYIFGSNHGRKAGELVEVTGAFDVYYGMPQLKNASAKVKEENKTFDLTKDALDVTVAEIAGYSNAEGSSAFTKVVRLEADIVKSGDYINMVDGDKKVSLNNDSNGKSELESFVGKRVELVAIILDYHTIAEGWRLLYIPGTATEAGDLTDAQKVDRAITKLENDIPTEIFSDITLPTTDARYSGLTITWSSSNTNVLSNTGVVGTIDQDTKVTLTATVKLNEVTKTTTIEITVKKVSRLTVTQARQVVTFDDKEHFVLFSGIIVGFEKYGYFVADENTSIYVRHQNSGFAIGDEVEIAGTARIFFGSGKDSTNFTQITVQVDSAIAGFEAKKLSTNNPLPLNPTTLQVTDFTSVPKTIEGTKNAPFYGKLVKLTGKLIKATSGNFTNLYIEDTAGNKVMIYHNSNEDALAKLNEALDLNVTIILMPIDQSSYDGWRLAFLGREGDLVLNITEQEKINIVEEEIATIIKDGDAITSDLDFRTTSISKILVPSPRFEWSTNSALIDSTGKVTRPETDTNVEVTVKIFLDDSNTPAATITVTVTVKQQGASVWTTETFDTFPDSSSSYKDSTFIGVNGIEWEYKATRGGLVDGGVNYGIDGKGIILANQTGYDGGASFIKATINGGIGDFKVDLKKAMENSNTRKVGLFINGELKAEFELDINNSEVQVFEVKNINISGTFTLELRHTASGSRRAQITVDNLSWTNFG